jgi:hypothetical protein
MDAVGTFGNVEDPGMSIGKIPEGENDVILRLKWLSQCDTGLIACLCAESPSNPMDLRVRSMHRAHHAAVGGCRFRLNHAGLSTFFMMSRARQNRPIQDITKRWVSLRFSAQQTTAKLEMGSLPRILSGFLRTIIFCMVNYVSKNNST